MHSNIATSIKFFIYYPELDSTANFHEKDCQHNLPLTKDPKSWQGTSEPSWHLIWHNDY